MSPLVALLADQSVMTQRHSACALWGLSEGKEGVYDKQIVEEGAVAPLIQMLMRNHPETRGFAAACLLCLCNDASAREAILTGGGSEVWLSLAQSKTTWLRTQAIEMLRAFADVFHVMNSSNEMVPSRSVSTEQPEAYRPPLS